MINSKLTAFILFLTIISAHASDISIKHDVPTMIKTKETNYKEADYVNAYCNGQIEFQLSDLTRIDCLTQDYAIEFDWAKKWAESVGQSLYYANMTNKKPAVAIIMRSERDEKYIKRIIKADKGIKIFKIKAYE